MEITKNKRLTVYNVAKGIGIKDRKIISRAGRLVLERCKKNNNLSLILFTKQIEYWRGKKHTFNVVSYPKYLKTVIIGELIKSQMIQKYGN